MKNLNDSKNCNAKIERNNVESSTYCLKLNLRLE